MKLMNLQLRDNSVHLEGYINVTNRDSKELYNKDGKFIEQIKEGVWTRALRKRNIPMLFNHDWSKQIGMNGDNVQLYEDAVGLRFIADIDNPEVVEKAKAGKLQGCSFGFRALKEKVEKVNGICKRIVEDLELFEVSLLSKSPAYSGCVIECRSKDAEIELELREFDVEIEETIEQVPEEVMEQELEEKEVELEVQEQEIQTQEEVIEETTEPAQEVEQEIQEEKVDYAVETQEFYKMWLYLQKNK